MQDCATQIQTLIFMQTSQEKFDTLSYEVERSLTTDKNRKNDETIEI